MPHKLVIVGAAGHVNLVLDELPGLSQVRLTAYAPSFAGEDVSRYARPDSSGNTPREYDDWNRMLDKEQPDIVVVCGRYDLNGPIATEAARRGCHVVSDKPAAQTMDDVAMLRQIVADRGVQYAIMLPLRYGGPYFTARALVRQGIIGEPYLITAQKSYRWGSSRPEWYADPAKYGSTMTWVGIHAFDFARWVSGSDYTEVFAYHANLVHVERPGCQDVATVIAKLSNGGSALFNLDYLRPDAAPTHGDDRLRIAGSKGVLEVCDQGTRLEVLTADEHVPSWPLEEPGRTLFGDFVAAIEGEGDLLVPAEDAFSITEFAIKAATAATTGRIVQV